MSCKRFLSSFYSNIYPQTFYALRRSAFDVEPHLTKNKPLQNAFDVPALSVYHQNECER